MGTGERTLGLLGLGLELEGLADNLASGELYKVLAGGETPAQENHSWFKSLYHKKSMNTE